MKKLFFIFLLLSGLSIRAFAQLPVEGVVDQFLPTVTMVDAQQTITGIVIIDDDELGITIAPNPANNSITITSAKDMTNKTFSLTNCLGVLVFQQKIISTTIDVSTVNSDTYCWTITDCHSNKLATGILIIQH